MTELCVPCDEGADGGGLTKIYLFMALGATLIAVVTGLVVYVFRNHLDTLIALRSYFAVLFVSYQVSGRSR